MIIDTPDSIGIRLKCDVCGRFIAFADFEKGATNVMVLPDSDYSRETWETLCIRHKEEGR